MTDMREYAAQHGWEVGSHLRYAGCVGPSSVITSIEAHEVRISTPGDFPGRLTRSTRLEKWTLDWQYRAEKAEATIARVRELHLPCTAFSVQEGGCGPGEHTVSDPPVCFHCQAAWPCPTVKALDGGKASRREPRRAETTTSEQERLI